VVDSAMEYVEPIRDRGQLENMKKYLRERSIRNWLLFILGINSGLRISDLLSLKVMDVRGRDRIAIREKKTGKAKDFPLSDSCKKAVSEYLSVMELTNGVLFPSRKVRGSSGTGAISRQQAYEAINEAARAVGLTCKIGTHTLRNRGTGPLFRLIASYPS
jgi:integrase